MPTYPNWQRERIESPYSESSNLFVGTNAIVAQLAEALYSECRKWGFESLR